MASKLMPPTMISDEQMACLLQIEAMQVNKLCLADQVMGADFFLEKFGGDNGITNLILDLLNVPPEDYSDKSQHAFSRDYWIQEIFKLGAHDARLKAYQKFITDVRAWVAAHASQV